MRFGAAAQLVAMSTALACGLTNLDDLRGEGGVDAAGSDASLDSPVVTQAVRCGKNPPASCDLPQFCCVETCSDGGDGCLACLDAGASCSISIFCSSPSDCDAGQVCCGVADNYFKGASCLSHAECDAQLDPTVLLCDPNATVPCPFGGTCTAGTVTQGGGYGLYVCQ